MDAVTDTNVYEPHQWKHSTIVAGVEWKNPVGTASGTFQLAACRWFYDVSQMGAICTKGVSPEPWQGNPGPRTAETPAGMVNSVGLQNPGVDHYLVDELPKLKDLGATVITNVAGHSDDEYAEVVAKLADSRADMLEINVSCPNVNHGGMSVGTDPEALHRLIDRLRKITSKPMIVKLSPNVTDITTIARAAVDAGADALSLINTMVGTQLADGMKVLLVDDVMTAGTAVREVIPKLKAEADVDIVGLVLSVDRMEKTKDSDLSAVAAVEKEFGFPVLAIANVREIFEAGRNIVTADGQPYVTDAIKSAADDYLERYGA